MTHKNLLESWTNEIAGYMPAPSMNFASLIISARRICRFLVDADKMSKDRGLNCQALPELRLLPPYQQGKFGPTHLRLWQNGTTAREEVSAVQATARYS